MTNCWNTLGAIALMIAVIAMGCGGGDDLSSAFTERANAACRAERKDALQRALAYQKRHSSEGLSRVALGRAATRAATLSTYEREIVALRKLQPPPGDQGTIKAILAAEEAALADARKVPEMPSTGRTQAAEIVAQFSDADTKLRDYGLAACAKA